MRSINKTSNIFPKNHQKKCPKKGPKGIQNSSKTLPKKLPKNCLKNYLQNHSKRGSELKRCQKNKKSIHLYIRNLDSIFISYKAYWMFSSPRVHNDGEWWTKSMTVFIMKTRSSSSKYTNSFWIRINFNANKTQMNWGQDRSQMLLILFRINMIQDDTLLKYVNIIFKHCLWCHLIRFSNMSRHVIMLMMRFNMILKHVIMLLMRFNMILKRVIMLLMRFDTILKHV